MFYHIFIFQKKYYILPIFLIWKVFKGEYLIYLLVYNFDAKIFWLFDRDSHIRE